MTGCSLESFLCLANTTEMVTILDFKFLPMRFKHFCFYLVFIFRTTATRVFLNNLFIQSFQFL